MDIRFPCRLLYYYYYKTGLALDYYFIQKTFNNQNTCSLGYGDKSNHKTKEKKIDTKYQLAKSVRINDTAKKCIKNLKFDLLNAHNRL